MKLSNEQFFELVQKLSLAAKDSAADNTSSFSDLLLWKPHPDQLKKARSCRLCIIAASFIGFETKDKEALYERISKIAHKYKYEGEWAQVEKHLRLPLTPYLHLSLFLQDRTLNDFYGNDFKLLKRALRSFKVYNPYLPSSAKVKKPQRKRGYDDKGHLRESWRPGPIAAPERLSVPMEQPHRDSHYHKLPDEYKERNNDTQRTLVEARTSWLSSDLEGDTLQMSTKFLKREKAKEGSQSSKTSSLKKSSVW